LAGLRLRLHGRLQLEPCQTVIFAPTPGVEPVLEPLAASEGEAEPRFRGSIWLRPPFPAFALRHELCGHGLMRSAMGRRGRQGGGGPRRRGKPGAGGATTSRCHACTCAQSTTRRLPHSDSRRRNRSGSEVPAASALGLGRRPPPVGALPHRAGEAATAASAPPPSPPSPWPLDSEQVGRAGE
jgi:hypothetical protein